jgi:DNA-binding transcriptional MerR regulator
MQIGEVADRVGLSLRTIRYYEEVGLAPPSARTAGGFRLYTESDVARLQLIKRMKPLDFTVEEIGNVLGLLDALEDPETDAAHRADVLDRLRLYHQSACQRVDALQAQADAAREFAANLKSEITRQKRLAPHEQ